MKNGAKNMLLFLLIFAFAVNAGAVSGKTEKDNKMPPEFVAHKDIKETLDALIDAYTNKNARLFMSFIAEDFTTDKTIFDRSINKDFSSYHNISIRYSLNNVTLDSSKKMAYVSLNFTRTYDEIKSSKTVVKSLTGELVFKLVNGKFKLYNMKKSFIFGISGE